MLFSAMREKEVVGSSIAATAVENISHLQVLFVLSFNIPVLHSIEFRHLFFLSNWFRWNIKEGERRN